MGIGENIARLRERENMTQEELALKVGVTRAALSHYEKNRREPDYDTLSKFSKVFRVTVDELLGNEPICPTLAPPLPPDLIPATRTVPILGSIPCGIPAAEYEDRLGEEFLPPDLPPGEYYYLYARGDSMEPTISDGEKVLIQVTTDVFNGRIYAVLIDHESTLKRVYRYDGRIELVPDNPKYPRQVYSSANIYIHGLVIRATRDIK